MLPSTTVKPGRFSLLSSSSTTCRLARGCLARPPSRNRGAQSAITAAATPTPRPSAPTFGASVTASSTASGIVPHISCPVTFSKNICTRSRRWCGYRDGRRVATRFHRHETIEAGTDALLDDLGARDVLVSLLHGCMEKGGVDATDYTTPFTVFYVFKVPRNRVLQFEEWVQGTIVCQSRGFPGYKGTLLYRPESASGSGDATYLLDCRYRGANNLKSWLMSDQRDLLYSQAEKQGLWVREATRLRVVQGNFGSVDNLWMDDKTEAAHRETEFAKWRVVAFKCFNVWLAVLVCGWPGMSIASTLKVLGFSKLATHTIAVTIAVAVVVFVAVPLTQPLFAPLLVKKMKSHPDVLETLMSNQSIEDADLRPLPDWMTATTEEQLGAALQDARALLQAAEDETLGMSPLSDGVVTAVLTHHVKPGRFEAFEEACQDLVGAAEAFDSSVVVGYTLVRPPPGDNTYTLIFRYESKEALERWVASEERARFCAKMYKLVQSPAEVKVQNYSAVELLLTGFGNDSDKAAPPPPIWKTWLLVTGSLYIFSLVSLYAIAPALVAVGAPFPLITLVTSIFNCASHSYTTTPILSRVLKPWLSRQTPIPAWLPDTHPLARWPIKGFSRPELFAFLAFYVGVWSGRWRPMMA